MKLLAAFVVALFVFTATPVFAEDVSEPNVVVGTLTENHRGTKVTAGFEPCGITFLWTDENGEPFIAYDPLARWTATISHGGEGDAMIWAHSIWRLDENLVTFGFSLTQDQIDKLIEDAAIYMCTLL